MDHVLADGQSEVAADGARGCLGNWVGAPRKLTPCVEGALALDDAGDQWCGGDELDELTEERLGSGLLVVLLCGLAVSDARSRAASLRPLRSMRAMISPTWPLVTPSGLMRMRVRSVMFADST